MHLKESQFCEMGSYLSGKRKQRQQATGDGEPLAVPAWLDATLHDYWLMVAELTVHETDDPDALLMAQLCEHLYVKDRAWRMIVDAGITELDTAHNNETRRHPAVMIWRQAADGARQCMSLLGMSPVSRARLKADSADGAQSEFMAFLQQRHGRE